MTERTSPATTISHRYPWSGEEKTILGVFTLGPPVVTGLLVANGGRPVVLGVVLFVLGWGVAGALYALGRRRKNASAITATLTGTRLAVTGGRVKRSRGDLARAVAATTTRMGPETVLVVELAEGTVLVPGRIVREPALAAVLDEHLVRGDASLTADARELLGV